MDRKRWERVEVVYHAALERSVEERAAFLAEACAGDAALKREVQALLEAPATAEGLFAAPAIAMAEPLGAEAGRLGSDPPTLIGRRLGVYHLQKRIGAGGMGEVYRARDTKLGRDVAIKVLPPAFALDRDRLSRFEREARVLAALNHPHIAAIYGFEEAGDVRGLVLELVEGPTLAERVAAGPVALTEALTTALQIIQALDAAHAKGIIHRDLKPANIKVTPGGAVKVLDFGLAKVWTGTLGDVDLSEAPTVTTTGTREGALLGTAAYMSPEQARGKPVDTRTDVWAVGCVLFEMLSGRSAFAGGTLSDTIARILEREPAWQTLPRSTPARVRALLRRCLQKDPAERLNELAEARRDLEACLASPFKIPRAVLESVRWNASRPVARASLGALAIVATGVAIYELRDPDVSIPQFSNPIQVTNAIGVEDHPTWSPDGRTLAYESNETGNWDVWLTQVGGGPGVNRTADHLGDDRYVSWSPDGRQIAFWSDRDGGGYYVLPALGGVPTRVVPTAGQAQTFHSPPVWSADSTLLAGATYTTIEGRAQAFVEIVSLVTRDTRRVQLPGVEEARLDLSWSADGRYLAYIDAAQQPSETTQMWVLRLSDGTAAALADGRSNVRRPTWSPDGRYLYFVSNRVGPPDLWRQRIADGSGVGDPERVTTGLEVRGAVFSPDGTKVAYSKGRWVSNIWRVPILGNRPAIWADAVQMTFEQAFIEFLSVSRDGSLLAYSSDRAGNQDVWLMPIGGEARQMTADPAPDWNPLLSPNEQQIAFYSYRTGDREIFVMPSTGGAATQLTRSRGLDVPSSWSPDGRQLVFRSERTGDSEIWVMAADGTGQRQITNHPAGDYNPFWSPDGQWLAYISNRGGEYQIWRVSPAGGESELLIPAAGLTLLWSANGQDIYFVPDGRNFQAFSLKDRRMRPLTDLAGRRGTLGSQQLPATDGAFLYFTWRDDLGDIWVMDVAAP